MEGLKKCHFCGGEADLKFRRTKYTNNQFVFIQCQYCGAQSAVKNISFSTSKYYNALHDTYRKDEMIRKEVDCKVVYDKWNMRTNERSETNA